MNTLSFCGSRGSCGPFSEAMMQEFDAHVDELNSRKLDVCKGDLLERAIAAVEISSAGDRSELVGDLVGKLKRLDPADYCVLFARQAAGYEGVAGAEVLLSGIGVDVIANRLDALETIAAALRPGELSEDVAASLSGAIERYYKLGGAIGVIKFAIDHSASKARSSKFMSTLVSALSSSTLASDMAEAFDLFGAYQQEVEDREDGEDAAKPAAKSG